MTNEELRNRLSVVFGARNWFREVVPVNNDTRFLVLSVSHDLYDQEAYVDVNGINREIGRCFAEAGIPGLPYMILLGMRSAPVEWGRVATDDLKLLRDAINEELYDRERKQPET